MHYANFIMKAKELCITQDEDNEMWYVEPEWVDILHRAGLGDLEELDDCYITDWLDVEDILKLETQRRNIRQFDKIIAVTDWFYDIISTIINPAEAEQVADFVKTSSKFIKSTNAQSAINEPNSDAT